MRSRLGLIPGLFAAFALPACGGDDGPGTSPGTENPGVAQTVNGYCEDKTPALIAEAGDPEMAAAPLTEEPVEGSACNAVVRTYPLETGSHLDPCSSPVTRFPRRPSGWLRASPRRSRISSRTPPRSFCSSSSPGRRPERTSSSSCVTGERSSSRRGSRRLRSHGTRAGRRQRGAKRSTLTRSGSSRTGTETPRVASASRTSSAG